MMTLEGHTGRVWSVALALPSLLADGGGVHRRADRLADLGLAASEQGAAIGPGRSKERAGPVQLGLAPDQQLNQLTAIPRPKIRVYLVAVYSTMELGDILASGVRDEGDVVLRVDLAHFSHPPWLRYSWRRPAMAVSSVWPVHVRK